MRSTAMMPMPMQLLLLFLLLLQPTASQTCSGAPSSCQNNDNNDKAEQQQQSYTQDIPGPDYFAKMRRAYFQLKDDYATNEQDRLEYHDEKIVRRMVRALMMRTENEEDKGNMTGARVPFEIRHNAWGRGIFTTQPIAKGATVWDMSWYGIFYTAEEWFTFCDMLPYDEYAVALHEWAYVMEWAVDETTGETIYVVGLDLDESSLMNHGGSTTDHNGKALSANGEDADTTTNSNKNNNVPLNNVQAVPNPETGGSQYVAARDIAAGEEILCDYSNFHHEGNLEWFNIDVYNEYLEEEEEELEEEESKR